LLFNGRAVLAALFICKVDASVCFALNPLIRNAILRQAHGPSSGFPEIRNPGVRIPERLVP
jgi:hypothetical protein